MGSERVTWLPLTVVLGLVAALAPAATADVGPDAAATASLDVEAARECATRDDVIARVRTRSQRIDFVAGGTSALRVKIGPAPRGVAGELAVSRASGKRFVRRIVAQTCAEVVDALALIIAITLDPAHVQAESALPGTVDESAGDPDRGPAATAPTAPAEAKPPEAARTPAAAAPEPAAAPEAHGRLTAGAGAHAARGPAPALMPGFSVHVLAAWERASPWSPAVRLSFAHLELGEWKRPDGIAHFALDAGELDACPLRWAFSAFDARACATVVAGRLSAEGTYTYSPRSWSRPFVAAGGSILGSLGLGRRFELAARFGGAAPLIRDAFQFTPVVFYRVASATLEAELGLAARFP